ncbi:hypothetical protein [Sabulicella rubraurantiaca]|uniref:hypothetical protein n=1 Tax=Sabulicella rubraurantiaca TaxID=2811429 RepID=UPI001A95D895|nr:hypothetical protein [Sabulicella rubraurantiaca]
MGPSNQETGEDIAQSEASDEYLARAGEAITLTEAAARLGTTRQALYDQIRRGTVLGMMTENGSILVPSVQFVTEGDKTVVLEKIECAVRPFLENHGDGWTALQWMLDRDPNLLETPLEALRKKRFEAVEAAARAYTCADER